MDKAQTHHWFKPWRATTRLAVSTVLGIIAYFAIAPASGRICRRASSPGTRASSAFCCSPIGSSPITASNSIRRRAAHARHPRLGADDARRRGGLRQPLWRSASISMRAAGPSGAARDPGRGDGGRLLVADPHRLLAALCPFLLRVRPRAGSSSPAARIPTITISSITASSSA